MNPNLPYWLAALHLPNIGPITLLNWLQHFHSIESLFKAPKEEWRAAQIPEKCFPLLMNPNWPLVEKDLAWCNQSNHIITLDDDAYPYLLKQLTDPPLVLYVQGNPSTLSQTQIAIVGSRNGTPTGLKNAAHFACTLAQAGFTITSGFALGVDAESHKGALHAKGKTIAVMGTGLNHIYPKVHQALVADILKLGGALISEFPLDTKPFPSNFPRRNRIISGLATGVLVVEAALKSGSLVTARHAIEQGREVFAIPGSIHNPLARGCHHLLRQGAKLAESATDIIEEIGPLQSVVLSAITAPHEPSLSKELVQVLDLIEYEITPMDMILLRSRLTAGEVSSILLTLELKGCIQTVPGGYVREIPK